MALGKYARIDNNRRQSLNYCSTVTIVVFVALCLVGVWMVTSSSAVPSQNVVDVETNTKQFEEDKRVDLPEAARKTGDDSTLRHGESDPGAGGSQDANLNLKEKHEEEKSEDKSEEKPGDKHDEVKPEEMAKEKLEGKSDENNNSGDRLKSETQPNDDGTGSEMQGGSNSEGRDTKSDGEADSDENGNKPDPDLVDKKDQTDDVDKKPDGDFTEAKDVETGGSEEEHKGDQKDTKSSPYDDVDKKPDGDFTETKDVETGGSEEEHKGDQKDTKSSPYDQGSTEVFPSAAQADLLNETVTQGGSFSTQAAESKNEKETLLSSNDQHEYNWKLCNSTAGPDYIPCLDNLQAIKSLPSTKHYEHRERHCPAEPPTCLVPLPKGYRSPIEWPTSRDKIWYYNVPHTKLAQVKGHQNWVKVSGEYLTFPGGGTQFKNGALHYVDFINESVPDVAWGKRTRVILDVGCGVASFGGYLFDRDVLTMSFAPKDEHEAQVQFALERGIPAISAVMGTKRLPFPGLVFDAIHCARCRVPWHIEGGKLLLELNRVLRPGGFFIWSATPVYRKGAEDVEIWKAMTELTKAMCWELVSINKDTINGVGVATFRKPSTNECYDKKSIKEPPMCEASDDRNAAWNVPLQSCMHNIPVDPLKRGSQWPEQWPVRLEKTPYWMLSSQVGVYGKPEPEDFTADYEHWKRVMSKSYMNGLGINWATVRNVMDMRSIYGGFAAALKDINVWVMNVVPIDSPDTLPIIYERGLFGIYHDWCESFSTYPRSYNLLHADHLFSKIKKRCKLVAVVAEVDRVLRPDGSLIVRDNVETIGELENLFKSMKWQVRMAYSKDNEGLLCVQKSAWRPTVSETITYAIA